MELGRRTLVATLRIGAFSTLGALSLGQWCHDFSYQASLEPLGQGAYDLAAGDFDGDSDIDFVTSSNWANSVSFIRNNGSGFFLTAWTRSVDADPFPLALDDVNGDGALDLVVGCADAIDVLLNSGSGGFVSQVSSRLPFQAADHNAIELAFEDLDGDGDSDLLVGMQSHGSNGGVVAALNNGAGVFSWGPTSLTNISGSTAVFADLDGDSVLDYAVVGEQVGTIRVHMGLGAGLFGPETANLSIGLNGSAIAAGDFDGDGAVDLVGGSKDSATLFRNLGGGAFMSSAVWPFNNLLCMSLLPGDLDNDGDLDLIATFGVGSMRMLKNTGAGTFAPSSFVTFIPPSSYAAALADLNADGWLDVVSGNFDSNVVALVKSHCELFSYCTAKINSLGCSPEMTFAGTASVSSSAPFDVGAAQVLDHKAGLLLYGMQSSAAPFQGGAMCVGGPLHRTPLQSSGGAAGAPSCSGAFHFDFNAHVQSGVDSSLVAGATVRAQYWSRDPLDPAGFGTSLSDALGFTLAP